MQLRRNVRRLGSDLLWIIAASAIFIIMGTGRGAAVAHAANPARIVPLESSSKYRCLVRDGQPNMLAQPRPSRRGSSVGFKLLKVRVVSARLKIRGDRLKRRALLRAARECRRMELTPPATPTPVATPPSDSVPTPDTSPTPAPTPQITPSPEHCFDGVDNDLDLAVDDEDSDCASLGTTFYVSNSQGNDTWSGLLSTPNDQGNDGPLKSLAAAVSTLRSVAQPGDRVLLRRGDVWLNHSATSTVLGLSGVQGTAQAPITLGAYGVNAQNPRIDIGGTAGLIMNVTNESRYLVVKDLTLTSSAPLGQRPQGLSVLDCSDEQPPSHIIFDGLEVSSLRYGVTLQGNHLTLKNSLIKDNFKSGPLEEGGHTQGLYAGKQCGGGSHIHILNNRFENNGAKESVFDWNVYLSCTDCSFIGNYVTDGSSGLKVRNCSRIHVAENVFSDIASVGISVGGSGGLVSEDLLIEQNLVRRTIDGITVVRQSIGAGLIRRLSIINNILMENQPRLDGGGDYPGYLLVSTNDDREDVLIAHNTFHQIRHKAGIYINASAGEEAQPQVNVQVLNNIIEIADPIMPALYMRGDASALMDINFNLYDSVRKIRGDQNQYYNSLASAQGAYPALELNGVEGDAALIQTNSSLGPLPLVASGGAGIAQAQCLDTVRVDFFDAPRPSSNCDIGAEER